MQQIVSQLIHKGDPDASISATSPWVDMRLVPKDLLFGMLEAQTFRRTLKTHLPAYSMVWRPDVKYLFVGRDARDMIWSLYNHFSIATPTFYTMINDTPGRVGQAMAPPTGGPRDLLMDLIEDDSRPTIPNKFWEYMREWWSLRDQPNILFLHFHDLKKDLGAEMRRVAEFLGTPELTAEQWSAAVEHCTFDWMKGHAEQMAPPQSDIAFEGGASNFINKGTNGRWKDVLSEEDNARLTAKAKEELGEECAKWLEQGGHI
jgi:aryl sulfotransferase